MVTAALPTATALARNPATTVIQLGGRIRGGTLATVDHWTFRMLEEGHRRVGRGTDLLVGIVEAHNRPHTLELLDELGLCDELLQIPHSKMSQMQFATTDGGVSWNKQ